MAEVLPLSAQGLPAQMFDLSLSVAEDGYARDMLPLAHPGRKTSLLRMRK